MRAILALTLALLLASALFIAWPGLDLATTRVFYDGAGFPVTAMPAAEALRAAMWTAADAWFVLTAFALALRRRFLNLAPRDWLFQTLVFILGPGLIVNLILKRHWGRARPFLIEEFGGTRHFSRAWEMANQCTGNCSFVSGEMAGSTSLAIALTLTLRANRARLTPPLFWTGQTLAVAIPLLTAWQRVAVGRHYLSDVVIAALLIGLLAAVLRQILKPPAFD